MISLRKKHVYLYSQFGNTYQPSACFSMPELTTVEQAGERVVQIRAAGVDKQQSTVMLAITAVIHKLQ